MFVLRFFQFYWHIWIGKTFQEIPLKDNDYDISWVIDYIFGSEKQQENNKEIPMNDCSQQTQTQNPLSTSEERRKTDTVVSSESVSSPSPKNFEPKSIESHDAKRIERDKKK